MCKWGWLRFCSSRGFLFYVLYMPFSFVTSIFFVWVFVWWSFFSQYSFNNFSLSQSSIHVPRLISNSLCGFVQTFAVIMGLGVFCVCVWFCYHILHIMCVYVYIYVLYISMSINKKHQQNSHWNTPHSRRESSQMGRVELCKYMLYMYIYKYIYYISFTSVCVVCLPIRFPISV